MTLTAGPYSTDYLNHFYELLFCDKIALYRNSSNAEIYPWSVVLSDNSTVADLQNVIDDAGVESRPKLIAANRLQSSGKPLPGRRIFGGIVEVGMPEGLDVLAAYEDGSARYINYSEKLIIWDVTTRESNELVVDLFLAARRVVDRTGPWERDRFPPPKAGDARITFLVSNGLYFGEGPFDVLAKDALGGKVIDRAGKLMNFLISNSTSQEP